MTILFIQKLWVLSRELIITKFTHFTILDIQCANDFKFTVFYAKSIFCGVPSLNRDGSFLKYLGQNQFSCFKFLSA